MPPNYLIDPKKQRRATRGQIVPLSSVIDLIGEPKTSSTLG